MSAALSITGVTDLGTLGGNDSYALGINASGQVVGGSTTTSGNTHGFLWQAGTMTDLGTLGGSYSMAESINANGQVVGVSHLAGNPVLRAFLWQNGTMTDLGTLGGPQSEAHAINASGQIVGQADGANGRQRPALWQNGTVIDLGTPGCCGGALGINDAGVVVGWMSTPDGDRDFRWQNGVITDLGTLGGENGGDGPNAINSAGVVVGSSHLADQSQTLHSYVWQNGTMTDLGAPAGFPIVSGGVAWDVNDSNWIVGLTGGVVGAAAFVWQDGTMTALPTLGGGTGNSGFDVAYGINNAGQIVGRSLTTSGEFHAALWTVTDAPPAGSTPAGTNVSVAPAVAGGTASAAVLLTFSTVTSAGVTTLTTSSPAVPPPVGFRLGSPAVYYDLTTTAAFTGSIIVCIDYSGTTFSDPADVRLFHGDGAGGWSDVTTSVDGPTTTVCGTASSLSPFAVAEPKIAQTIAFTSAPPNPALLASVYQVGATGGGSGNPVGFSSLTPAVCSVGASSGNAASVALIAVGTCVVAATQAGNSTYAAAPQVAQTFSVVFNWNGFFAPVSNPPTLNVAKAGSAIPFKFTLGGNQGLSVLASGSPTINSIACGGTTSTPIGESSTAGASGLTYDAQSGHYTYVWKTQKAWSDTCLRLLLQLTDGTTHVADFKFIR